VEQIKKKIYKYIIYKMKCKTKEISQNIIDPTTFKSGYVYIITAPITVLSKLTIEDNVDIYLRNGGANGLTFASSSELHAGCVNFYASDDRNVIINVPNNGGVVFNGTAGPLTGTQVVSAAQTAFAVTPSKFVAKKLKFNYCGGWLVSAAPTDALTINNCNFDEWGVQSVSSAYSGDEGVVVNDSTINLNYLSITNPAGDGLEINDSIINIYKGLKVQVDNGSLITMTTNQALDSSPLSYIKLPARTKVYLDGAWAAASGTPSVSVKIVSNNLPQPVSSGTAAQRAYYYKDCTECGQSYIFPSQ
jgi:hypothetical protein